MQMCQGQHLAHTGSGSMQGQEIQFPGMQVLFISQHQAALAGQQSKVVDQVIAAGQGRNVLSGDSQTVDVDAAMFADNEVDTLSIPAPLRTIGARQTKSTRSG